MPRDNDAHNGIVIRPGTMDAFVFQEMAEDVYRALDYVRPGDVVLDIGANVGAFACHVISHVRDVRVICVEPIASNCEVLRRNVGNRATVEVGALSAEKGELTMYDFGDAASACHSLYDVGAEGARAVRVPSQTLAGLMEKYELDHVRFLKMDCQGAEFEIIPATPHRVLARIDCIALEIHPSIWGPRGRIGNIPGSTRKMLRSYRHLIGTHVPAHGEPYRGGVEVWLNRAEVPAPTLKKLQRKYRAVSLYRPLLYPVLRGAKRFVERLLANGRKRRTE
jgi:FkbM family methyltransferase